MSSKEPYDYISTATPDTSAIMNLAARGVVRESYYKNQIEHLADDGTEEIVGLSTATEIYLDVPWGALSESDAGTIIDYWMSATLGNGKLRTFPYVHAYGGTTHTYVVRFKTDVSRTIQEGNIHGASIQLKIKGRVPD